MKDANVEIRHILAGLRHKIWNAKGAYAKRCGIGPDVIQVLMSFPSKREFNQPHINFLIQVGHSRPRRILHCPSIIQWLQNLCGM